MFIFCACSVMYPATPFLPFWKIMGQKCCRGEKKESVVPLEGVDIKRAVHEGQTVSTARASPPEQDEDGKRRDDGSVLPRREESMAESKECITLMNCTAKLEAQLRNDRAILHTLLQKGLIGRDVYDDVTEPRSTLSEAQRAGEVVREIKRIVSINPRKYGVLLEVFKQNTRVYGDIVEVLNEEYSFGVLNDQAIAGTTLLTTKVENPPVEKFPYLQADSLTEGEKERLILRLERESKKMQNKFSILVSRTKKSLERHNVTVGDLRITFKNNCELCRALEKQTDLGQAWETTLDYMSFFNYEPLYCVIESYCEEMKQEWERYISEFKVYCQRRLCEIPMDIFSHSQHVNKEKNLHLKIDKEFKDITANEVKELQVMLSELLDTTLYILTVAEGCIELVFKSFQHLDVICLDEQQKEKLRKKGASKLYTCEQQIIISGTEKLPPLYCQFGIEYYPINPKVDVDFSCQGSSSGYYSRSGGASDVSGLSSPGDHKMPTFDFDTLLPPDQLDRRHVSSRLTQSVLSQLLFGSTAFPASSQSDSESKNSTLSSQQIITDEMLLIVVNCLMHNADCQILDCPCRQLQERYKHLSASCTPLRRHKPSEHKQNVSGAALTNSSSTESKSEGQDSIDSRKAKLRLDLDDDKQSKHLHPHYHITTRSHIRRTNTKTAENHRRSRSLYDLTPITEVRETPEPITGGIIKAESPVHCAKVVGVGKEDSDSYEAPTKKELPSQNIATPILQPNSPILREISLSSDNIPMLCLNDCLLQLTPSPKKPKQHSNKPNFKTVHENNSTETDDSNTSSCSNAVSDPVKKGESSGHVSTEGEGKKRVRVHVSLSSKRPCSPFETETTVTSDGTVVKMTEC